MEHDTEESLVILEEERPLSQGELRRRIIGSVQFYTRVIIYKLIMINS